MGKNTKFPFLLYHFLFVLSIGMQKKEKIVLEFEKNSEDDFLFIFLSFLTSYMLNVPLLDEGCKFLVEICFGKLKKISLYGGRRCGGIIKLPRIKNTQLLAGWVWDHALGGISIKASSAVQTEAGSRARIWSLASDLDRPSGMVTEITARMPLPVSRRTSVRAMGPPGMTSRFFLPAVQPGTH